MTDINHDIIDTKAHNKKLLFRHIGIPVAVTLIVILLCFIFADPEDKLIASIIWGGIVIFIGLAGSLAMLFDDTCPYCNKYLAAEEIGSKLLDEHITVRKEQFETEIKTKNMLGMTTGKATETREVLVPTKVSEYEIFKKCKYCNSEWTGSRTVEKKQA